MSGARVATLIDYVYVPAGPAPDAFIDTYSSELKRETKVSKKIIAAQQAGQGNVALPARGMPKSKSVPTLQPLTPGSRLSADEVARLLNARAWVKERSRIRELLSCLDDGSGQADKAALASGLYEISLRVWPPLTLSAPEIESMLDALPTTDPEDADHATGVPVPSTAGRTTGVSVRAVASVLTRGNVPAPTSPRSSLAGLAPVDSAVPTRTLSYMPNMHIVWPQVAHH